MEKEDIVRALKVTLDEEGEDIMSTLAEQWIDEGVSERNGKKASGKAWKKGERKGMEKR